MFMKMLLQRTKLVLVSGLSEAEGSLLTMTPGLILLVGLCLGLGARGWVLSQIVFQRYAVDGLFDALSWNLVTNGSFSMDGTTAASHIVPLYPALLALLYGGVGHQAVWFPTRNMGVDVITAF
jgi:hypothetical protein